MTTLLELALAGLYITIALTALTIVFMGCAFIVAGVANGIEWLWRRIHG